MSRQVVIVTRRVDGRANLVAAFANADLEVHFCNTPALAINAIGRSIPVGVLVELPGVNDDLAAFCSQLRQLADAESVPVLFVGTGDESVRTTTDALIVGGDGYFRYPVDALRLVAKIAVYAGVAVTPSEPMLLEAPERSTTPRPRDPILIDVLGGQLEALDELGAPNSGIHRAFERTTTLPGQEPPPPPPPPIAVDPGPPDLQNLDEWLVPTNERPAIPRADTDGDGDGVLLPSSAESADDEPTPPSGLHREPSPGSMSGPSGPPGPSLGAQRMLDHLEAAAREQAERIAAMTPAAGDAWDDEGPVPAPPRAPSSLDAGPTLAMAALPIGNLPSLATPVGLGAAVNSSPQGDEHINSFPPGAPSGNSFPPGAPSGNSFPPGAPSGNSFPPGAPSGKYDRSRSPERIDLDRFALDVAAVHEAVDHQQRDELVREMEQARQQAIDEQLARDQARIQTEALERAQLDALAVELEAMRAAVELERQERDAADAVEAAKRAALQQEVDEERRRADELAAEARVVAATEQARQAALQAELEQARFAAEAAQQQRLLIEAREQARRNDLLVELAEARAAAEAAASGPLGDDHRVLEAELEEARAHAARVAAERLELEQHQARHREGLLAELAEAQQATAHERAQVQRLSMTPMAANNDIATELAAAQQLLHHTQAQLAQAQAEQQAKATAEQQEVARLAALHDQLQRERAQALAQADAQQRAHAELAAVHTQDAQRLRDQLAEQTQLLALETAALLSQEEQRQQALSTLQDELVRARHDAAVQLQQDAHQRDAMAERLASLSSTQLAQQTQLEALQTQQTHARGDHAQAIAVLEQQLSAAERIADDRAHAMRLEEQRAAADAAADVERLQRLRAELDATSLALEEQRRQARLAFQSGRFDAVTVGSFVAASEAGQRPRSRGDEHALLMGGGFAELDEGGPIPELPPYVELQPPVGRFAEGELFVLLASAQAQGITGALRIEPDGEDAIVLHLEQGEPVLVVSPHPADRPEELLLRGGYLTARQYSQLRAGQPEVVSVRRLAAQLVEQGALKASELFPAVRGVMLEQVLRVLACGAGVFSYHQDRPHAADRLRLAHTFDVVLAEGIRRKWSEDRLWRLLGGPSSMVMAHDASRLLPPLSAEEQLAVARLDGTRSLEDIVAETTLPAVAVLRAAAIVVSFQVGSVVARGLPGRGPDAATQLAQELELERNRTLDRLAIARHGDYFALLGVPVDGATAYEVHRAAQGLRQRYAKPRFDHPSLVDLGGAAKEILDVVNDAEAVLADDALRASYARGLIRQVRDRAVS